MDKGDSLEDLGRRIDEAKKRSKSDEEEERKRELSPSRLLVELLSAVAAGSVIGYFIDRWLDLFPIFFLVFFFLGVAAGVLNIYKLASKPSKQNDLDGKSDNLRKKVD